MTETRTTLVVGVLALQGAFAEHMAMLERLSGTLDKGVTVTAVAIRLPEQLENVDALVLPGGESTTIGKVAVRWGLVEPLKKWVADGRPIWGTCAGMIMLSQHAKHTLSQERTRRRPRAPNLGHADQGPPGC